MVQQLRVLILTALAAMAWPLGIAAQDTASLPGFPVAPADSAAMLANAAPAASAASPAARPLRLEVDLSERKLYVLRGKEEIATYAVAVGAPEHATPKGGFTIQRVIWNPRWVPPDVKWARGKRAREPGDPLNPMGRVKMFFVTPDYYIHGTHREDSLGKAESHGCIRMRNPDVIELAQLVMEHGGEARSPGWFQRVINRVRSAQEVRLSRPVPFTVRA